MCKRIILAALVGGVVMFIWGALAWMVLPLHTPTIKEVPNEDAMRAVIRENIKEPGFYELPGWGHHAGMTKEQQDAAMKVKEQKYKEGPRAVMVLLPDGADLFMSKTFVTGIVLNILVCLVAAWLLSKALGGLRSYGARVQFVTILGLFAGLAVHLMYWNWFEFPTNYTIACLADTVIGWTLVGLAIAAIVKPTPA